MKIIFCLKHFVSLAVFFIFLVTGCAHNPVRDASAPPSEVASPTLAAPAVNVPSPNPAEISAKPESENNADEDYYDEIDEIKDGETVTIADPLEPFNRAMHHFNDKLYFWLLKPVAQGYKKVVPEPARVSVDNFFFNLGFPARFLNCLLQADFRGAATEFGRFSINTIWGIGGLMDPAAGKDLDLRKQDTDLGLTLAYYGVGHGFYLVWPVFGPSSPRDSLTILSDYFLYPVSYLDPWYYGLGTKSLQIVNGTSLRIGDYESLKDAAIDPYVAFRDAYLQYRLKKVKGRNTKTETIRAQDK
ncbi:MAG: VacJ family lipoprotein [Deltaproteobacteria bacterium HGW-Deltaproteobacteria-12]|jgi:phospholipid-binding lipoprotein MlaA|nr:MAG: VacJ family lipoprotein [Deltaproteobacteria bacterium HGW-Deltaproteobacteria-12]